MSSYEGKYNSKRRTLSVWEEIIGSDMPAALILNTIRVQESRLLNKRVRNRSPQQGQNAKDLEIRGLEVFTKPENSSKKLPEITNSSKQLLDVNLRKIRSFLKQKPLSLLQTISCEKESWIFRSQLEKLRNVVHEDRAPHNVFVTIPTKITQQQLAVLDKPAMYRTGFEKAKRKEHHSLMKSSQKLNFIKEESPKRKSIPQWLQLQKAKKQKQVEETDKLLSFKQFCFVVNLSNEINIKNVVETTYKAFVCLGNNGSLVKGVLKNRPWWIFVGHNEIGTCNLVWTEWKRTKLFQKLKNQLSIRKYREAFEEDEQTDFISPCTDKVTRKDFLNKLLRLSKYTKLRFAIRNSDCRSYFAFSRKIAENKLDETYKRYTTFEASVKRVERAQEQIAINHLEGGLNLHSKRLLFLNLKHYCEMMKKDIFDFVPLTFIVEKCQDKAFQAFSNYFSMLELQAHNNPQGKDSKNIWICKPGENSNRGNGIVVLNSLTDIRNLVKQRQTNYVRTLIIQKYIEDPFLYYRRKFDIRCYLLVTCVNGITKAYWFDQGYIRTSSKQFTLKNIQNRMVHLTNDAVQKKGEEYGKYENNNKISFDSFQKYLDNEYLNQGYSISDAFMAMKGMARQLIKSVQNCLNPSRRELTFELFGLDFMINSQFKPILIQANSNPCLETSGPLLSRLIPQLIDNVFRIAVDPLFPPPEPLPKNRKLNSSIDFQTNKFQLIFDELFEYRKPSAFENKIGEDESFQQEQAQNFQQ